MFQRILLNRGTRATAKINSALEKLGRKKIFLAIFDLPRLVDNYLLTDEDWETVDKVLSQCHLYKDPVEEDAYYIPYGGRFASKKKVEALRHFIDRHGNSYEKKLICERLASESPAEELSQQTVVKGCLSRPAIDEVRGCYLSEAAKPMSNQRRSTIPSPCNRDCGLDEKGVCRGCMRTYHEIVGWLRYSVEERRRIMEENPARRAVRATQNG